MLLDVFSTAYQNTKTALSNALLTFFGIILLTACTSAPHQNGSQYHAIKVANTTIDLNNTSMVKEILHQQHNDWRHTKHRLGGISDKGIDCSGLVYLTYREKLGYEMPRTTEGQADMGKRVYKEQLQAGDLVFFKTGLFSRHVGMYVDDGKFLHVSSSRGVKMSTLDSPYWSSTYWKAQRIRK